MTAALDSALADALDHIDDDAPATTAAPVDPPYIAAIPASAIFADSTYQRPLDELRVQRIVADWDPRLLGVIEVSARDDGRYALIDGQHRWASAIQVADDDDAPLVCNVHTGLTPQQEARLFYEIDSRRRSLTGWDRWYARRGAGDPQVLAIEEVVAKHGLEVRDITKDGVVRSTKACTDVAALGGLSLLDQALEVVLAAYGKSADGLEGPVIHGAANVLHHYADDGLDLARLVTSMQEIAPRQLKARANALREAQKGTQPKLISCVLVDRYNAAPGRNLEPYAVRVPSEHNKGKGAKGQQSRENEALRAWAKRTKGIDVGRNISPKLRTEFLAATSRKRPAS